jgi:hypothetical protein
MVVMNAVSLPTEVNVAHFFQSGFQYALLDVYLIWKLIMIRQEIILLFTNSNKNLFSFKEGIPLCLMGYRINKLVTSCRQTQQYIPLYIILNITHCCF